MWRSWLALSALAFACTKPAEEEKKKGPIVEDTAPYDTGMDWLLDDTGTLKDDTAADPYSGQDPRNNLTIEYSGYFDFAGGTYPAYDTMTGEIHVVENLDHFSFLGENKCYWIFLATGKRVNPGGGCTDCDFAMEVTFEIDPVPRDLDHEKLEMGTDTEFETAIGECEDYDLPPTDGLPWTLGFSTNTVYLNYSNSGFWLPWYAVHDDVLTPDRFLMDGEDNHYEYGYFYEYDTADDSN
jgi:hypothetical protein